MITIAARRPQPERAGVDPPGPREGFDHRVRRLRPHARRPPRQRHRLQRLPLRGSANPYFGAAQITRTGDDYDLVGTQDHWVDRKARTRASSAPRRSTSSRRTRRSSRRWSTLKLDKRISLYADIEYRGQQWGMAIDMNTCTGCTACVIACVAENNIPVVGKAQVQAQPRDALAAHRSLLRRAGPRYARHLLPADALPAVRERALRGGVPGVGHRSQRRRPERHGLQPVRGHALLLEQLPLESAPVQLPAVPGLEHAAVQAAAQPGRHRPQPRHHGKVHLLRAAHQRRAHPGQARCSPDKPAFIADGEILTACQAVCPTEAIVFGDINDPNSRVARLKASPRNYTTLEDLNTRPRTTYLAAVKNPNPALPHNPMVGGHQRGARTTAGTDANG